MNTNEARKMNTPETKNDNEACPLDAIVNPPCNEVLLMDCMEGMKQYPDKFFDIAIVDPPYGISVDNNKSGNFVMTKHASKNWDRSIPKDEYWDELFRVSKDQIVFGGNYFDLPKRKGWICWDKMNPLKGKFSDFELAWSSILNCDRLYRQEWIGFGRHFVEKDKSIHPTQKPIRLYEWIMLNFCEDCETILDTHVGSGSSRIAAHKAGKSFIGFEIDKDYWEAQEKRFKEFKKQLTLF